MATSSECLEAFKKYGSKRAAANALGMSRTTFRRKLAECRDIPDGYFIEGKSTLYDEDGNVKLEWVKSHIDADRQREIVQEALKGLSDTIPMVKAKTSTGSFSVDLMACYPVGDAHFGMRALGIESGEDFDLDRGEKLMCGAIDHLVETSPKCDSATIAVLGDFLHYDGLDPVTPTNKNPLDTDCRYPQMVRAAVRCIRYTIERALDRHNNVHVIIEVGNHDLAGSQFLAICLANIYENEPRVTVDESPSNFHYFEHGKCLVGTHHGHGKKLSELPLLMATHKPEEWGRTKHRYWWTGHVHHDQVKEYNGCRVESFRILPPADAYAANHGYVAGRDMKAIILHREYGEVARHLVTPQMLDES